ncbi:MAG: transketolase family protein [Acutalibacteraceae bacterium]
MEMRQALCECLDEMMAENENIVVIDADLAKPNGTFPLRKKYPERAIDVGIAEQNMASVAAGMSSYGFIPFITSFTPFASRRICDQIAISIAYAKQTVKILGSDPGISAEFNGGTHMSMEDIGVLRSIPELVIYEPVDVAQFKQALPQIVAYEGLYISVCSVKPLMMCLPTPITNLICLEQTVFRKVLQLPFSAAALWYRKP